ACGKFNLDLFHPVDTAVENKARAIRRRITCARARREISVPGVQVSRGVEAADGPVSSLALRARIVLEEEIKQEVAMSIAERFVVHMIPPIDRGAFPFLCKRIHTGCVRRGCGASMA
ncbi:hypothetical protein HN011_005572, partial [Eciton burchellii]